ncbi:MAG TPA: glucans biosynthesis glucosyltransferase MdoH [Casimicrobiaceae bacterium]|nr:glucans biosynthesis glucosyltransferase MdoH [Casimicrobiaceae bacterium]
MELPVAAELTHRDRDVVERYLDALGLAGRVRDDLAARIRAEAGEQADARALFAALHAALADEAVDPDNPSRASVAARVALAASPRVPPPPAPGEGKGWLPTAPPLARTSMAPRHWLPGWWEQLQYSRSESRLVPDSPPARSHWRRSGLWRRLLLVTLIIGQTYLATDLMVAILPYHGRQPLEIPILILFAILFGWISAGFWTALAGYMVLAKGGDRWMISRTVRDAAPIAADARTAVIMPIANEDVGGVFARLRATCESVARATDGDRFDFFVLSDSANPDTRVAEVIAWFELCRAIGFGRVFYRWRAHRIKRKSGNVADFCRRWGRRYRYMIVLDADSVMSGECIRKLVQIAEANPDAGILQTAPRATGRDTLYARVQQFATGVYGPLFTAGLHYWQLGESHYWGHNAIIRIAPFVRHCALGRLPGSGNLSGEILSHDFVEAALMRRAGWKVWIVYDLPGSYEEMPPNLIDELKRDRRWCQGNLMNFRLALMKGLHPAHRVVFMTGVMAYLSAPLWFLFLVLSTALLAVHTLTVPEYFVQPYQLFPQWPEWRPDWALRLVGATAVLLFVPKILATVLLTGRQARSYGGRSGLWTSLVLECLLSALLAPIRMLFHTRFVVMALTGLKLTWRSPARDDAETTWSLALRHHGLQTLIGVAWTAFVAWLNPAFLGWVLPVAGALIVSIPLSVYTSRVRLGRRARSKGLFLIPEEIHPPRVIRATRRYMRMAGPERSFVDAAVDPVVNAIACAIANDRRQLPESVRRERAATLQDAVLRGVTDLSLAQKTRLLNDPSALSRVHSQLWMTGAVALGADETHEHGDERSLTAGEPSPRIAPLALE